MQFSVFHIFPYNLRVTAQWSPAWHADMINDAHTQWVGISEAVFCMLQDEQ